MAHIPSLPIGGPLRLLAIAASASLLSFAASALLLVRRARRQAWWAAAPLAACVLSFTLGRLWPPAHAVASAAALLLATRNVARLAGAARVLQGLGLVLWVVAMFAAARLFGR